MNESDILKKCLNLIWDYGELYDKHDIMEFQSEHLYLWSQYEDVLKYIDKLKEGE